MASFFFCSSSFSHIITFIKSLILLYFISKVNFKFYSINAFCSLLILLSVKNNFSFFYASSYALKSYNCKFLSIYILSHLFNSFIKYIFNFCMFCAWKYKFLLRTNTLEKCFNTFYIKRVLLSISAL